MTSHTTKVIMKLSVFVDISTESHPDDIPEATLREIIMDNAEDHLQDIITDRESLSSAFDDFEIYSVKQEEE